jgi:acyl-CoA synthetase (AMP-forming)/AMP-acid ligase II
MFRSPLPDVEIPATPLTAFVLRHAGELADQPALIDGTSGLTLTYADLVDQVHRFAGGLAAAGIGRGDVVAIMAPNMPAYAVVFHGTALAGGAITTINPTYTADEVRHQLNDSGARILVTISPMAPVALQAAEGTKVERVVSLDPCDLDGVGAFGELLGEPLTDQVAIDPAEDVVTLPYSSGTTGLSKGVELTHRNLVANLVQVEQVLPLERSEVMLSVLPFFHIYGMQVLMNGALAAGGTVVTMPRFDLEQFLTLASTHRIKRGVVVPPIVLALAKHPLVDQFDLSSVQQLFSGAAPLGAELAAEAAARLDCEVVQGYGMTELSPVSHATPDGEGRPGTIGILVPNTEARIVDPETGVDLGVGEDGELWVRGPQVMKGYLNNPTATAATIDADGWLHTGDIGHVDDAGHYLIVDRLKELIKYKGFQVPPAELEALLVTHPAVADVAVIGVPDEEAGELPKAFVVLKPGAEATAEELQDFVAGQVAHYKQIRIVSFTDEIPKSASGKILRRLLRD